MATAKTTAAAAAGVPGAKETTVAIKAPNFRTAIFPIVGTAPYVQNRFAAKALEQMKAKHEAGSQGQTKRQRQPKDFRALYEGAKHVSAEGWCGIPAPAFRAAMISACRTVSFKMTHAKLSVFVEADGFDKVDGTPLVKITKGQPHQVEHFVRNETGVADIRPRPQWREGWEAQVRVRWDLDQFSIDDVTNLLARAGMQVGIGEGRPDSRNSAGMGWGLFAVGKPDSHGPLRLETGRRRRAKV